MTFRVLIAVVCGLLWTAANVESATITVCASGCTYPNTQLQAALNAATDGDTVLLESGFTYTAPSTGFILGEKCGSPSWDCITVRTGVNSSGAILSLSLFPAEGVRITEADAVAFAKLIPSVNNQPALRTVYPGETGTSCAGTPCTGDGWTVKWIEFVPKIDWASRALVRFGTNNAGKAFDSGCPCWVDELPGGETQDTLAEVPQYLTLYQCYVHGDSFIGQHQGLILASKDARVLHNMFDDIKSTTETQAITFLNGVGPYDVQNNYIAASGENVMAGGADSYLQLSATVTGTPTSSSIDLASPVWVHLDGTTQAASLPGDIYSGIYISITHAGTDYGGVICTISASTCTLSPTLPFIPSVGDVVKWSWLMGGLTFKYNLLDKKSDWINPFVPTPTGVTATAGSGGSLPASTYCYRVATFAFVSGTFGSTAANSTPSPEQCEDVNASGKVTVSWTGDSHATKYRVYAGSSGAQDHYFDVTAPTTTFDDTGAAGTAGTPPAKGTLPTVKNNFELKHCDGHAPAGDCVIQGNIFNWSWCCVQSNIISMKVNNQNTKDVSVTVRELTFRDNWIRHGNRAISLTCTTTGNASPQAPSGPMTDVTITNNLFTDLSDQYVGITGTTSNSAIFVTTGSYANEVPSKGCVRVSFTHNTFLADTANLNGPIQFNLNTTTDKMVDFVLRDNIMARDCITAACISNAVRTIKTFNPNNAGQGTTAWTAAVTGASVADHNVWPDGTNTLLTNPTFPTANTYFPTDAALKVTDLTNYTNCKNDADILGCKLKVTSSLHSAASDSSDLGANIDTIKTFTDIAIGGASGSEPPTPPPTTPGRARWKLRIRGN
jgi:hypothetical protein